MRLPTSSKIIIARALFCIVKGFRAVVGKSSLTVTCMRNQLKWQLDLSQGIDLSIFVLGSFEPSTSRALKLLTKPGMTVIDVGANIGAHSLPLAKMVGESGAVIAIEPTDWAFSKLKINAELNPSLLRSLLLVKAIITDCSRESPKEFYASWKLLGNDKTPHPIHGGSLCPAQNTESITLDELIASLNLPRVDLLKLDVDGFEYPVLAGGVESLTRWRPVIIMELCPYVHLEHNQRIEETIELLRSIDYIFLSERDGKTLSSDAKEMLSLVPTGGGINVVCCHESRKTEVQNAIRV